MRNQMDKIIIRIVMLYATAFCCYAILGICLISFWLSVFQSTMSIVGGLGLAILLWQIVMLIKGIDSASNIQTRFIHLVREHSLLLCARWLLIYLSFCLVIKDALDIWLYQNISTKTANESILSFGILFPLWYIARVRSKRLNGPLNFYWQWYESIISSRNAAVKRG